MQLHSPDHVNKWTSTTSWSYWCGAHTRSSSARPDHSRRWGHARPWTSTLDLLGPGSYSQYRRNDSPLYSRSTGCCNKAGTGTADGYHSTTSRPSNSRRLVDSLANGYWTRENVRKE
jgi:hypothetical protein